MLGFNELKSICTIQIDKLIVLLQSVHNVECVITAEDIALLTRNCYANSELLQYGARPMKRYIEKEILDIFALLILEVSVLYGR